MRTLKYSLSDYVVKNYLRPMTNIDKELYRLEEEKPDLSFDLLNLKIYID